MTLAKPQVNLLVVGLLIVACVLLHGWLRFGHIQSFSFDYDQEMILLNARKIWNGDLTLIGTRVGDYPIFVGPAYFYLTALLAAPFHFSPYFMFYYAYFWSLGTLVALILVTRQLYSTRMALLSGFLYACSPLWATLDRISWNPNPLPLLAVLIIGATLLLSTHPQWRQRLLWLIGISMWFGCNSHFVIIVLVLWFVGITVTRRRWHDLIIPLGCVAVALLPLIAFDVRHDWVNIRGLFSLLSQPHSASAIPIEKALLRPLLLIFELQSRTLLSTPTLFGVLVLVLSAVFHRREYQVELWFLYVLTIVIFMWYRGPVPEYYFMFLFPLLMWFPAYLLSAVFRENTYLMCVLIAALQFPRSNFLVARNNGHSLWCREQALAVIKKHAQSAPIRLIYRMHPKWIYGYAYIAQSIGLTLDDYNGLYYSVHFPKSEEDGRTLDANVCEIGIRYPNNMVLNAMFPSPKP